MLPSVNCRKEREILTSVEQRCIETSSSDLGLTWDRRSSEVTRTQGVGRLQYNTSM